LLDLILQTWPHNQVKLHRNFLIWRKLYTTDFLFAIF